MSEWECEMYGNVYSLNISADGKPDHRRMHTQTSLTSTTSPPQL